MHAMESLEFSGRPFLYVALCVAAVWPSGVSAGLPSVPLPPEVVVDFEWFGTLGFPDVRSCPSAHVTTGLWISQSGNQSPTALPPRAAFLLRRGDDGHFTVLTPDLFTRDYTTTPPGTPEYERVGYEEASRAADADASLDALTRPPATDAERFRHRFEERLSARAQAFVWAWACWRNGLEEQAARLYARAAALPGRNAKEPEKTTFRQRLEGDLGYAMIWRAMLDFDDPAIPRPRLLACFERIADDYPASEYAPRARQTADLLRTMVAEDTAHCVPAAPLASLPPEQRVAELIFRLRDQHGSQLSQPGECNVFSEDLFAPPGKAEEEKSPAMQLADLGFAAVPQLIAAMDDQRFSRSVSFGRDFVSSYHVLTIGSCAKQILSRIAGMPNFFFWENGHQIYGEDQTAQIKRRVESWWENVRQKGEKQMLIDLVSAGGHDANEPAGCLYERYPDAALGPLIEGAKKSSEEDWAHARFVSLAGELPGDDGVPFFEEVLNRGVHLEARLAAAEALRQHGHADEATAAMIREWEKLRYTLPSAENKRDYLPQDLIGFLTRCRRADALAALGHGLRQCLVSVRMNVVKAMAPPDLAPSLGDQGADEEANVASAREALLVSELDDDDELFGTSVWICGQAVNDPKMGDVAGTCLARRFPGKYAFDLDGTSKQRDRQRLACLNIWRGEHGQKPLPLSP